MPRLARAVSIADLRLMAQPRLPRSVFDFFDGGAEDETTLRGNRQAFERVRLRPRVLVDVHAVDTGVDLEALAQRAARRGDRVWIDSEDSSYVDVTLDAFRHVRARHESVGLCLQSYLRRTPTDLEALLPLKPAIRLVKGAYAEPPERAFPDKRDTDAAYLALGSTLIEHAARQGGVPPVLGTHDARLVRALQQRALDAGLDRRACEVHMLYGIRVPDQEQLHRDGYAVRVLISYGAAWFRWYMRRLAERPANIWFVLRSVVG